MDKKAKLKIELAKKLKKETSTTGTGASVTPGVGAGVATKYAFGKRDNKGTPKDWKAAPSIPNRPSKAMDYKELWEGKMHIGTDTKTDSDIYFEPSTGTFSINVIDAAGNRTNKLQVNYLSNQVAKIYAPENLSKLYKNRFFSSKSFIKLYTLIYNDLYKALHSTSELMHNSDINKLLDSIIAKCSKEIMSMKEEGAIMLCAIALQLPIAYRSMHPRGLPKTKIRQSQHLKKLPLKKNKLSIEINKMINNKENNYAGYRSINHNNKIIKKLKVKKRLTIKKQHKSRKPRKYKSRKSRKYKSRKNKSFRKNN